MVDGIKEFKEFLGMHVALFVEDKGFPYPRKKTGILISANNSHLILKTDEGLEIGVLRDTVLRIENR